MRCFPCMQSAGRQRTATQTPLKKDKCTFHGIPTHSMHAPQRGIQTLYVCMREYSWVLENCAPATKMRENMHNMHCNIRAERSQQSAEIVRQLAVAVTLKELARTHFPVYSCFMFHTCTHIRVSEAPILAAIYMINMCGHTVHFAADYIHSLTYTCETKLEYIHIWKNIRSYSLWKR